MASDLSSKSTGNIINVDSEIFNRLPGEKMSEFLISNDLITQCNEISANHMKKTLKNWLFY